MCERFTFQIPSAILTRTFGLAEHPTVSPRYNIAPTQQVAIIRQQADCKNSLDYLYWGLIPSYVNSRAFGRRLFNARSETVAEKPAFRRLINHRRCLVLASGYYEWKLVGTRSQPMYVILKGMSPMIFAGLWDRWESSKGEMAESCTIMTTASNLTTNASGFRLNSADFYQYRMPVILHQDQYQTWLDQNITDPASLVRLYRPYPVDLMERWPVSPLVNSLMNDSADLIIPMCNFPRLSKEPDRKAQT